MLTLNPTDTLSGSADSAAVITCTMFGDAVTDGLDAFRVLYQGALPMTPATLLPAGEAQRLVKTIQLANTVNSAVSFQFYVNGVASVNRMVSMTIPALGSASFGQDGWHVYDSRGNLLTAMSPPDLGDTLQMTFGYGDASPADVATAPAGRALLSVRLVILEAFDGIGAALTVGDATVPDRFITASQNAPGVVGLYETTPLFTYGSATNVLLTITPGSGATRGRGLIQLEYAQ